MASGIRILLEKHGSFLYGEVPAPLRIEITDTNLNVVATRVVNTDSDSDFAVQFPGTYAVIATAPSGAHVQQVVNVPENEIVNCRLPVHHMSPHEDHEWAYLTHKLESPTTRRLIGGQTQDARALGSRDFDRAWLRLWRREGSTYQIQPNVRTRLQTRSVHADGVVYTADFDTDEAWCLQVGGPQIPWKCVALPPSSAIKVLVRSSPWKGNHPLQVVVSSNNLALEGLLAYLQRGELEEARELEKAQAELAERFLQTKRKDETAAAIGGYYLLRIQALDRLHDWVNNLANWFEWMSDGAVIHAWQLITEYRRLGNDSTSLLDQARDRLLQAVDRGFPIYTEGLRLLRDGLLLFEQRSEGNDLSVHAALQRAGQYMAAADWTTPTTTFTGETPDSPSPAPEIGVPTLNEGVEFLAP